MKHFITGILLVVAGCGGGSGGSSVQTSASSQPATNNVVIEGKVIDGYVAGATVFIDMNWSLAYEHGEPKTITDANGNYSFKKIDLVNFPCSESRAIVVDVPAGAIDTTRGIVPAPYRMIYLPIWWLGGTVTNSKVANVTPFTSLFAAAVAEGKDITTGNNTIPVEQSCGEQADRISANVRTVVKDMAKIFTDAGVSLDSFYDDFIASNNNNARLKGEQIVDYLIKYKAVSDLLLTDLQMEYGTSSGTFYASYSFNVDSIRTIFNSDPPSVSFDLYSTASIQPPSGPSFDFKIYLKGLRLRKDGAIITSSCQNADPYTCPTISITNAQTLTKAALEVDRRIVKKQGDSFVFNKNPGSNSIVCEKQVAYNKSPRPTITTTPSVTDMNYQYKLPIDNKQALFDCTANDEGIRLSKRVEYTPRANGYYYSVFTFNAPTISNTIKDNFPYAVSHFNKDIRTSVLDPIQIENELNSLPTNPSALTTIANKYTDGYWFFETGSNTERSILTYVPSDDSYTCVVFSNSTNSKLRELIRIKDWQQALNMCYPDLSMF